jgi:hypothetical protein
MLALTDKVIPLGHERTPDLGSGMSALAPVVLQKSKVAGSRFFRENPKREAIADSNRRIRVVEARL